MSPVSSLEEPRRHDAVTRRELEVIRLVAKGLSGREVAMQLCRSPRTVENHLRSVYQKFGVRNRVEMLTAAAERGLLKDEQPDRSLRSQSLLELKGRTLDLIRELDSRMARAENDRYFGRLALALADVLGVRWAGISEPASQSGLIDVIVLAADGKLADQFSCQAEGSPCGRTFSEGQVVALDDVPRVFPHWPRAREFGVRSYIGVRLDDRLLGTVGTLWIMDDKPMAPDIGFGFILRLFAARTAAELALAQTLDRGAPSALGSCPDEAGTDLIDATS